MKKIFTFLLALTSGTAAFAQLTVIHDWAVLTYFDKPIEMAIDTSGNLYTANYGSSTVSKIDPNGTVTQVTLGNNAIPRDIVIDPSGNVYTANFGNDTVSKITSAGNVTQAWASLPSRAPIAIALDASNNIYTANNNKTVSRILANGTAITQDWAYLATDAYPKDIIVDNSGNVYTVNQNNTISKITPSGTVTQTWATLANNANPQNIVMDTSGNLYVANLGNNTVSKITPAGNVTHAWATLTNNPGPLSLSIDASGNLYTGNNNSTVSKISPTGIVTQVWATLASGGTYPQGIVKNEITGDVYTCNYGVSTISKITASLPTSEISTNGKNLTIYPNPVKSILYFSEELSEISLLDMSGRKILEKSEKTGKIAVENLPKGNYLLTGKDKNGKKYSEKLIKE